MSFRLSARENMWAGPWEGGFFGGLDQRGNQGIGGNVFSNIPEVSC